MAIDFDKFLAWAEDRFDGDVVVRGDEIKLNSIFIEDYKHHLWCNPYGGKHDRENGVYHCWKTDEKGSLISLVMMVDKCGYEDALVTLDAADADLVHLEEKIAAFWDNKPIVENTPDKSILLLPEGSFWLSELNQDDLYRQHAENYLNSRKMPIKYFMIATESDYKGRLVIPYYNTENELIYFNTRYIGKNKNIPRYLGPPVEVGIGKSDVIYMPFWPKADSEICLTEGEFDAVALKLVGLHGGALGGKVISEKQIGLIRPYRINLCLDNDSAGKTALASIGDTLIEHGFSVCYIRPPTKYKDWNEMLINLNSETLIKQYIDNNKKKYTMDVGLSIKMRSL